MSTLFLDRKELTLSFEGQCIALYENGCKRGTVPLHLLERVVMRGQITLDTRLLGALADKNIGVLMLSGRNHRSVAMLLGKPHNDTKRRIAQYASYLDQTERQEFSRRLVIEKLCSQKRLLAEAQTRRPDLRHALSSGVSTINGLLAQLSGDTPDLPVERLRGFEGSGAAAYFKAYGAVFAPSLAFNGRKRRPPTDPVNACLSLGYTLLHFDAVKACHDAGLDPFIGFYHDPAFGRESLACDFIEPVRAELDAMVWRLFRERALRPENFVHDKGSVILNKAGRQRFYAEYELFARPVRRLLRRYGYLFSATLPRPFGRVQLMRPLYIEGSSGTCVALEGPALCVSAPGKADRLFPLSRISRVVVSGAVDFYCLALLTCADYGISVTFLNENGELRARCLAKPGARQAVIQRLADLIGRTDGMALYQGWFNAMERMAVRSTARKLMKNRSVVVTSSELRAFLTAQRHGLSVQSSGRIFNTVRGMLCAQLTQLFHETGLDAGSELLQEQWLDLTHDFALLLFLDLEVPLLNWLETLETRPSNEAVAGFYEARSGRIAYLFRGLLNKLHCWLVELY